MLLEPGGYITPHNDSIESRLSPINIALNHPKGCKMKMKGHEGYVPFKPGSAIIVHGTRNKEFEKLVERSYAKNGIK